MSTAASSLARFSLFCFLSSERPRKSSPATSSGSASSPMQRSKPVLLNSSILRRWLWRTHSGQPRKNGGLFGCIPSTIHVQPLHLHVRQVLLRTIDFVASSRRRSMHSSIQDRILSPSSLAVSSVVQKLADHVVTAANMSLAALMHCSLLSSASLEHGPDLFLHTFLPPTTPGPQNP